VSFSSCEGLGVVIEGPPESVGGVGL